MAYELMLANVELPISLGVDVDMQDATKHSFIILGPSIILPDTQYYNDEATYNLDILNGYIHSKDTDYLNKVYLNSFWDHLFPLLQAMLDITEDPED